MKKTRSFRGFLQAARAVLRLSSDGPRLSTLANGFRVVTDRVPGARVMTIGVYVRAGSCDDPADASGVHHFLEHMILTGTKTRSERALYREAEAFGGDLNAQTDDEMTAFTIETAPERLEEAAVILADVVVNPTFRHDLVARERDVVLEEILTERDDPDQFLEAAVDRAMYGDHPRGRSVLGTSRSVRRLSRADLIRAFEAAYVGRRMVLSVSGDVEHAEVLALAERLFAGIAPGEDVRRMAPGWIGGATRHRRDGEQAVLRLAFEAPTRADARHFAAEHLASILGGGAASRLFERVRNQRGLVYAIHAVHHAGVDAGSIVIETEAAPEKLPAIIDEISAEIRRTREFGVDDEELRRAKAQARSNEARDMETSEDRATRFARAVLEDGHPGDDAAIELGSEAVTRSDVHAVARRIFLKPPAVAAYGDLSHLPSAATIRQRLGL